MSTVFSLTAADPEMEVELSRISQSNAVCWAVACIEHSGLPANEYSTRALHVALQWSEGACTMSKAREVALETHRAAKQLDDGMMQAYLRACGHTCASAHMKRHALFAANYIIKAMICACPQDANQIIEAERSWQRTALYQISALNKK